MKKILLAIIVSIILIDIAHLIIFPEFRSEQNLAYANGMGYLFISLIFFIAYVVIRIPVTLIVDYVIKRFPPKKQIYDYLIQLILFSIPVIFAPGLAVYVYLYFHLLFLFRVMKGKKTQIIE
ncbi:hypothetical protein CN514_10550 [Bacillus sp. AFS001701]|uniref:hypothetical protein n=1 Tax=Bacillaceae TaxID=186817 RepID=UPI000BF6CD3A|nr:hypothetical protein [Bacillus sp. AFS001701]PET67332.1 hypothetical protein CN514_10550 [Bacillus sp. AFS001701]